MEFDEISQMSQVVFGEYTYFPWTVLSITGDVGDAEYQTTLFYVLMYK